MGHMQIEGSQGSPDKKASCPSKTRSRQVKQMQNGDSTKVKGRTGSAPRCNSTTVNIADTFLGVGR